MVLKCLSIYHTPAIKRWVIWPSTRIWASHRDRKWWSWHCITSEAGDQCYKILKGHSFHWHTWDFASQYPAIVLWASQGEVTCRCSCWGSSLRSKQAASILLRIPSPSFQRHGGCYTQQQGAISELQSRGLNKTAVASCCYNMRFFAAQ